jgi:hypothetical protein
MKKANTYGKTIVDTVERLQQDTGEQFEVVMGELDLLTLDLDSNAALWVYEQNLKILQEHMVAVETGRWTSKSGEGTHVTVRIEFPMEAEARAGLQAMLGSDPKRELLGYLNVSNRDEEPFALFKPKGKVTR